MSHRRMQTGFTIVELLIVIVVIGILAAIAIVAFNGVQQRAQEATLKSNLANAAKLIAASHAETGTYPTTIPSDMKYTTGVGMSLADAGSDNAFCINAQLATKGDALRMYYDSTTSSTAPGVCSGTILSGSESGTTKPNLISSPDFASGWSMSLSVGSQPMSTRAGTASDPYPNKPVLIWTNNVSRTTSWAVMSGAVDHAKILSGKTYQMNYWVRKTGTGYNGSASIFGVMDGSTSNKAINTGANQSVNATWTKVSGSSTAIANAVSSNRTYVGLSSSYFPTTGWTIEFQGFELYEQ